LKALVFRYNLPGLAATKLLGFFWSGAYLSGISPLRMEEITEPELPSNDWVRVRTRMAGICGSDAKQVLLRGDFDNPLTALISFPHVLGHEGVGVIQEIGPDVNRLQVGQRVVVNPWLTCVPRGIHPPCSACQEGDLPLCRNIDGGSLPPGIHLGNNSRLPGVFAQSFVCHESQCFPVPDRLDDKTAVLADPFSVSLHSVLRNQPPTDAPAIVYGLGVLGQMVVAILRNVFPQVEVYAIGRYPHQLEMARSLGAHQVLPSIPKEVISSFARLSGFRLRQPWNGLPWLLDGAGVAYDTVGSPESLETLLKLLRPHAHLVMSGVEAPRRFEWTPLYFKEIHLVGSNAFGFEERAGVKKHAFEIFFKLVSDGIDLRRLVTHQYPFYRWREAFQTATNKGKTGAIKVALNFSES
jgi:threonine dehydrogenase-like Zn-dependent dehydrogenase